MAHSQHPSPRSASDLCPPPGCWWWHLSWSPPLLGRCRCHGYTGSLCLVWPRCHRNSRLWSAHWTCIPRSVSAPLPRSSQCTGRTFKGTVTSLGLKLFAAALTATLLPLSLSLTHKHTHTPHCESDPFFLMTAFLNIFSVFWGSAFLFKQELIYKTSGYPFQ